MKEIVRIPYKQAVRETTWTYQFHEGEEPVLYCPNCDEVLYEADYPTIEILDSESEGRIYYCPICELGF